MSAVQSLIERGVELKPLNSSEGQYNFPLHQAITKEYIARGRFRHFEMNVFLEEKLEHGFACLFVSFFFFAVAQGEENTSRRLEVVKLILKNWPRDLDIAEEFNHQTPL